MKLPWGPALVILAISNAGPALAHTPMVGLGGFSGGLLHPVLVPAHGLALLGLGLLVGQQALRDRFALLLVFAAALLAGIGAIVAAVAVTGAATVILAIAGVSGILVAVGLPALRVVSAGLAAILGAALALDSVPEAISMRASLIELAGTAAGAGLIVTIVAALAAAGKRPWQRIGARILASWTAASAIFVLALQFAR